jgi:hypothetical protein
MKMFNPTRKLMMNVSQLSILLVAVCSIQTAYAQYPDPTVDLGTTGDFLWKDGVTRGRTANLTNIGPYLVNLPEAPGSSGVALEGLGGLDLVDTIWDLSDLANPVIVHEFSTRGQPIQAHATIIRFGENGPRLFARGSGNIGYNPSGTNTSERLILDGVGNWPYGIFSHSHMTSPYVTRPYWSYNLNRDGVFAIHDGSIFPPVELNESQVLLDLFGPQIRSWQGVPYLYWDHFAVADVTGFTSFNGNMMIQASDQLNNGIAIYDIAGMKEGRMPRLLSVYQPELQEPDGNPIGIGGYWVEPYGATKMVWAARESSANGRGYPAMYVVDFEDPRNPYLSCEVYFDQVKTTQGWGEQPNVAGDPNRYDGDVTSNPMYVNFQDQYAYVDHFRVDIDACESAMAAGNAITGPIFDEVVYKFEDTANQCDSSQYFRPLGQLGVFGGGDWYRTPDINEQGMCGFVTSDTPDTNPPYVSGNRPLTGQTDYPIDGFIHIHIPETLRTETLENAVVVTNTNTNTPITFQYQLSHTGTISIFPDNYFAPNTRYRVDVSGIQDFMGNTMVDYSFTFSTDDGNLLQGETPFPPLDYDNPAPAGIITLDTGEEPPADPAAPAPTYTGPSYFPNQSSPISCEVGTETGKIWTVNPDNDSISIISSSMGVDMVKSHQVDSEIRI